VTHLVIFSSAADYLTDAVASLNKHYDDWTNDTINVVSVQTTHQTVINSACDAEYHFLTLTITYTLVG